MAKNDITTSRIPDDAAERWAVVRAVIAGDQAMRASKSLPYLNKADTSDENRARNEAYIERAVFVWKTDDPDLAEERLTRIVRAINNRPKGGRVRRLCQDATNEKYFCKRIKKALGALVPVENLVSSETREMPNGEKITMKQLLGSQYVAVLNDNQLTLPPERYLYEDHRLPKKEKGTFVCEADDKGRHGDTFDSGKNSIHGHITKGDAIVIPAGVGSYVGGTA